MHKEKDQIIVCCVDFCDLIILKIFILIKSEINQRKKMIQEYDNQRRKNEKLDEIDIQAKEESEYLLKHANELRQEQEDEIKRLNEVKE